MHGTVCRLKSSWRPSVVGTQTSSLWMGAQFLEDDPRHQSGRGAPELLTQRDGQTVGEEGDEQVRLDAVRSLMKNGAQTEVPFAGPVKPSIGFTTVIDVVLWHSRQVGRATRPKRETVSNLNWLVRQWAS